MGVRWRRIGGTDPDNHFDPDSLGRCADRGIRVRLPESRAVVHFDRDSAGAPFDPPSMTGRLARAKAKKWKKHRFDKNALEVLAMGRKLRVRVEGVDTQFLLAKFKKDRRFLGVKREGNGSASD